LASLITFKFSSLVTWSQISGFEIEGSIDPLEGRRNGDVLFRGCGSGGGVGSRRVGAG